MHTRCARFPVAGLGLRCSVFGPRRRTASGTGYPVPGTGCPVPDGTRDLGPDPWMEGRDPGWMFGSCFEKPAHGVCMVQDRATGG